MCVDHLLWATSQRLLFFIFLPDFYNCQQDTVGCDETEKHCDKEVTPPLLGISKYISVFTPVLQYPFSISSLWPASCIHPFVLLHYSK